MGLLYHPDALKGLPPQDAKRIKDKIDWLWANRYVVNHFPLRENLSGFYKRRIGRYRIIYTYDSNPDDMVVRLVGSRDDIYDMPF
ncbi:MAG: type II toxin-antitoxin system RelE/ParE family toxin [Chloroflexi bacterium]|nr:type II toxin-antitoxin system RelE/ParE family toxin [Chloroflexota bacterium]MCH8868919.1 type II toxin-antitoxin system RelE/ParE family toxin [Chloroflexota bacterium]